jgi:hypothetical protein
MLVVPPPGRAGVMTATPLPMAAARPVVTAPDTPEAAMPRAGDTMPLGLLAARVSVVTEAARQAG